MKTNNYIIDRIKDKDYKRIPLIYADSFDEKPWEPDWYDIPQFDPNSTWVARFDGHGIGFVISFISKGQPYISVVALKKAFHGQGIASEMIRMCKIYWKENGYKQVTIHVNHESKRARYIYDKLGFKALEVTEKDTFMACDI